MRVLQEVKPDQNLPYEFHLEIVGYFGFLSPIGQNPLEGEAPTNKWFAVVVVLLASILGYPPQTHVSIEYIRSLGDWKTAWDHVHFRGFLGTPMTFQFTWQGCDSILAAPLVIDLVRLTERAWRSGEQGVLRGLAPFFKSPLGVEEQDFSKQCAMLDAWIESLAQSSSKPRR
jgi:hypothetical protein